jgi:putative phosphoesterase
MRIVIASDIHGSARYCGKLLDAFRREDAEKLLLLGDLLYHGPRNDLPEGYAPKEVTAQLSACAPLILGVRGNCDAEIDQMVLPFPMMAEYCLLFVGGRTIFATHGHLYNTASLPPLHTGDILLHGHTHVPCWEEFGNGNLCLNPGSVSLPKENSPRGYLLLTDTEFIWKDLDGIPYHRLSL